jgi:hypothetical protein
VRGGTRIKAYRFAEKPAIRAGVIGERQSGNPELDEGLRAPKVVCDLRQRS